MGAKVFIDCAEHGMPWAVEYYARQEVHRTSATTTTKRAKFVDYKPFHFCNLADAIVRNCHPGDDVIIVCHGARHRLGLYPSKSCGFWMNSNFIHRMSLKDPDLSGPMGLSDAEYESLTDQLMKIYNLKLNHVMLQACRIGNDSNFLRDFGYTFHAKSISAPKLRTAYINTQVYLASTDAQRDKFRRAYPLFFEIPTRNRGKLILASKMISRSQYDVTMLSDSWETLTSFLVDNFPSMPFLGDLKKSMLGNAIDLFTGTTPTILPLHGFVVPDAPHKFYFPNDPRYAAAITFVQCHS
jgi:hypothetical protein